MISDDCIVTLGNNCTPAWYGWIVIGVAVYGLAVAVWFLVEFFWRSRPKRWWRWAYLDVWGLMFVVALLYSAQIGRAIVHEPIRIIAWPDLIRQGIQSVVGAAVATVRGVHWLQVRSGRFIDDRDLMSDVVSEDEPAP